ncbi:MAG: glycosyltransferase family 2 protein, partial [Salibacteraceae bacterium]
QYIRACVESVVGNDYPKDLLHVLVCDGQSDDRTREIVAELSQKHAPVKLVDNPYRTTPYALNLGIREVNSDVAIILGGHAELAPDYLRECVLQLKAHPEVGCIGGIIDNVAENTTAAIVSKAMASSFGVGNAHFRTGGKEGYVDTVAFGAYRREVFEKVGYFDEDLTRNQDDEFNYRVLKGGFKIWLSSKIRSKYYVRASFKKLFRQYFQYGYWKVFVNRKHQAVTSIRQLVPLGFVLFVLMGG